MHILREPHNICLPTNTIFLKSEIGYEVLLYIVFDSDNATQFHCVKYQTEIMIHKRELY